nr:MAG TPA: DNA glycosylase [Caudoviricetes sp.]
MYIWLVFLVVVLQVYWALRTTFFCIHCQFYFKPPL